MAESNSTVTPAKAGRSSGLFFPPLSGRLALVPVLLLLASTTFALSSQELNRVTFTNETGRTIVHIHGRISGSGQWGPDLLTRKSFRYGTILGYYIHYQGDEVAMDILAVDDQGRRHRVDQVKIRDGVATVVEFSPRTIRDDQPALRYARVFLSNNTSRLVSYLFISPESSVHWGFDLLQESSSLEPGSSLSFQVPVDENDVTFELLAITRDHELVQRRLKFSARKRDVFLDFTMHDLR